MQPPYLFLIRPRRFGKSLTLAMLEAYYDVNHAEQFDELFGQLYIGQHPTKLHNQFLIMRFNFSEVSSNVNEVELSFKLHCCSKLKDFVFKYEDLLGKKFGMFLMRNTRRTGAFCLRLIPMLPVRKIFVFIYSLMNMIISPIPFFSTYGTEFYRKATHGEGFIRGFFNVIKSATTGTGALLNGCLLPE